MVVFGGIKFLCKVFLGFICCGVYSFNLIDLVEKIFEIMVEEVLNVEKVLEIVLRGFVL